MSFEKMDKTGRNGRDWRYVPRSQWPEGEIKIPVPAFAAEWMQRLFDEQRTRLAAIDPGLDYAEWLLFAMTVHLNAVEKDRANEVEHE